MKAIKAMKLLNFIVIYSLFLNSAYACPEGLLPDSDWKISRNKSLLDDQKDIIVADLKDRFMRVYSPIVAEQGGNLKFILELESDVVNAYAQRDKDKNWLVTIMGGLVNHELMTKDALALVICHELGHHIGGAPRKMRKFGPGEDDYPTNEGQSDYFASMKCFRKVFGTDDNKEVVRNLIINETAKATCETRYGLDSDQYFLCQRASAASYVLAKILNRGNEVSFDEKDSSVVTATNDSHPKAQCRLDTYFAGALCDNVLPTSNTSELDGMCNRSEGDSVGVRPLCWFKPKAELF